MLTDFRINYEHSFRGRTVFALVEMKINYNWKIPYVHEVNAQLKIIELMYTLLIAC